MRSKTKSPLKVLAAIFDKSIWFIHWLYVTVTGLIFINFIGYIFITFNEKSLPVVGAVFGVIATFASLLFSASSSETESKKKSEAYHYAGELFLQIAFCFVLVTAMRYYSLDSRDMKFEINVPKIKPILHWLSNMVIVAALTVILINQFIVGKIYLDVIDGKYKK